MPIYMDRHDVSEAVTAEIVAQIHQEDLKIQDKYGCRGLTYWFDDVRKTAFCLVEAPDKNAIIKMHESAHGEIPHQIIEVDSTIVESFLGRIEDPQKALNTDLNIINDPAFRTIMVITFENHSFKKYNVSSYNSYLQDVYKHLVATLKSFDGNIVQLKDDGLLISFLSVTNAVLCALKIQQSYAPLKTQYRMDFAEISIGLHAGVPVTEKASIFEDTIQLAERMHFIPKAEIVISTDVKELFESENMGDFVKGSNIHILTPDEEKLLQNLMEFTEKSWKNTELKVDDFQNKLGASKSKLYRDMIHLTGKSPNTFLLNYRLRKSLQLLQKKKENISEVAFDSGFSSPSYFTKCFRKKYEIMPSELHVLVNA